jgi:hypothetical protein
MRPNSQFAAASCLKITHKFLRAQFREICNWIPVLWLLLFRRSCFWEGTVVIPSQEGACLFFVVVMGRFELVLKALVCLLFIAAVSIVVSADQLQHEDSVVHAAARSTTSSDAKFFGGGREDWSYSSPSPYGGSSPLIPVYGPSSGASPSSGPGTCEWVFAAVTDVITQPKSFARIWIPRLRSL